MAEKPNPPHARNKPKPETKALEPPARGESLILELRCKPGESQGILFVPTAAKRVNIPLIVDIASITPLEDGNLNGRKVRVKVSDITPCIHTAKKQLEGCTGPKSQTFVDSVIAKQFKVSKARLLPKKKA